MSNGEKDDIAFAKAVSAGISNSCELFVNEYTELVLSKVWNLSKTHCSQHSKERVCSLIILQKQRKGPAYFVEDQCDDCMDSYTWFIEFLIKKVKAYKGTNNCTLKTFVWSLVNANSTYIDWLRWKYGRGDRCPSVINALDETCQQTFIYLRYRKNEIEISKLLGLSMDDAREKIKTVRNELIKAGLLDLIEDPRFVPIHSDDPDTPEMPIASGELGTDSKLIVEELFSCLRDAVSRLPDHQSRILKLRYKHQLSAKDILGFCRQIELSLVPGKDVSELKEQDVFYALNTAVREVFKQLKSRYKDESLGMENLKYIFEEIGL